MTEVTWILDPSAGQLTVEGLSVEEASALAGDFLPPGKPIACAVPLEVLQAPAATSEEIAEDMCVRVAGYWHRSLIEGPGRRSVAKLQGCGIRCIGCVTPDSWDPEGGSLASVERLADALLDPIEGRDGVTILGGEPTAQPEGLLALVRALRSRGCAHIVVYSGHAYKALRRRAEREPAISAMLDEIDVLIDGPYLQALADRAGPWTGSGNQRVIDMVATRRAGRVVCLAESTPPAARRVGV